MVFFRQATIGILSSSKSTEQILMKSAAFALSALLTAAISPTVEAKIDTRLVAPKTTSEWIVQRIAQLPEPKIQTGMHAE